jgi:hypothetical protein
MNMGIEGFGVARKDILTGQSLSTLDSVTTGITNDNVYSVEANGNDLWIGTDSGAWIWDGATATKVLEGGFYERPQRFYDFELDGSTMYAGTNLGLCKYSLSGNFISASTCNAFTPIGQVTEVAVNSTTIFAGTNTGVYLIDKTTMTVVDTWTTDDESADAEVVVIDDVAYIGLSGIGVGRLGHYQSKNGSLHGAITSLAQMEIYKLPAWSKTSQIEVCGLPDPNFSDWSTPRQVKYHKVWQSTMPMI